MKAFRTEMLKNTADLRPTGTRPATRLDKFEEFRGPDEVTPILRSCRSRKQHGLDRLSLGAILSGPTLLLGGVVAPRFEWLQIKVA